GYQNGSVTLEDYLELLHGQSVVKSKGMGSLCTEKKLKAVLFQLIEQAETSSFYQRFSQDLKNVEESCPQDSQVPPRLALRLFLDVFNLRKGMEAAERLTTEGKQSDSLLFLHFIGTDTAQHENKGVALSFEVMDNIIKKYHHFLQNLSSKVPISLILTADHGMSFIEKNIFLERFLIESGEITFNEKKGVGYLFDKTFDKNEADKYYSLTTPAYWAGVSGMLYSLRVTDRRQTQRLVHFIHQSSFPGKEYLGDCYWWDLSSEKSVLKSMREKPVPEAVVHALSDPRHSDIAPHILCTPSNGHSFFAQAKKMEGGLLKEKTVVNKGWHGYFAGEESPEINSLFLMQTLHSGKNAEQARCVQKQFQEISNIREIIQTLEAKVAPHCL
ncbi:MAG: alkaline phosphatase family protein, partial [bacterium]|nr:alkaline phosphatase family protein [bacterium]